jgi:membrane protein DedA with SNARE-associated domain
MDLLLKLLDWVTHLTPLGAYSIVFGMLLICGLGLPLPEDITLILAGVLAYEGIADVWVMIGVGMVGVLLGDSIIFFLGYHYGSRIAKMRLFRRVLSEERLQAARKKMKEKKGYRILFFARFMPGLRAPFFFTAGTLHVPYRTFLLYDGSAALISVPLIVYAAYHFGGELERVVKIVRKTEQGILIAILVIVGILAVKYWLAKKNAPPTPKPKH